ncbi:hypothetical protein J6590_035294 [Homalodisca vitripennis]|nr:hypothetical protein J6590_035294 [Homalodisca vitripennis]
MRRRTVSGATSLPLRSVTEPLHDLADERTAAHLVISLIVNSALQWVIHHNPQCRTPTSSQSRDLSPLRYIKYRAVRLQFPMRNLEKRSLLRVRVEANSAIE